MSDPDDLHHLPDEDLAKRCSLRPIDEPAWRELWRRFYPYVRRKIENLLAPFPALAQSQPDDILQYAFLNIFHRLPNFDPSHAPLRAYLGIIVTSTVLDQLRIHKRDRSVPLEEISELGQGVRQGHFELDELLTMIRTLVARMEPKSQLVLQEFLEGHTPDEIAAQHRTSRDAVYAIVYRFRRSLKEALSDAGYSPRTME